MNKEELLYQIATLQQENKQLQEMIDEQDGCNIRRLQIFELKDKLCELQQENKQLKEQDEYLKNQKENKNKWFQLIADIGFDYDGYNDVESLKHLIDELVKYSLNGRDNYEYEDIFEELENGDGNE